MKFPFKLRPDQLKALHELNNTDHLIYIAATGSGKSILFQKYIHDHPKTRAVLISPLNALSRQQSERFSKLGIKVFYQESPQGGESGVWVLSPEKIQGKVEEQLHFWQPQFLIVDEAHCVWEWGAQFRPAYLRVLELVKLPSIKKSLWCSATLPVRVQSELKKHLLTLDQPRVKKIGLFTLPSTLDLRREKLSPEVRLSWLRNMLGIYADQSGMIFCNTRLAAVSLQKYLHHWGIHSFYYHAGLSVEEKLNLELQLKLQKQSSNPVVVVATSAFGMGMDYSFFKFCILFEPPFSILSLVQAIGRVGRATSNQFEMRARAYVLWHPVDFIRNRAWINQSEVYEWCRSLEKPAVSLENYFNDDGLSGTMMKDVYTGNHTHRTTSPD
jgi:ATP-dependent DNA helicase RecQ